MLSTSHNGVTLLFNHAFCLKVAAFRTQCLEQKPKGRTAPIRQNFTNY